MARTRNPRYAPEFLERRLNPSYNPLAAPAEVMSLRAEQEEPPLPEPTTVPSIPFPDYPPNFPTGPVGPG